MEKVDLTKPCWCTGWQHYHMVSKVTDLREMETYESSHEHIKHQHESALLISLHKRIESRINAEQTTTNFDQFGLNGDLHEWLKKEDILAIIEEEFGKLGNI